MSLFYFNFFFFKYIRKVIKKQNRWSLNIVIVVRLNGFSAPPTPHFPLQDINDIDNWHKGSNFYSCLASLFSFSWLDQHNSTFHADWLSHTRTQKRGIRKEGGKTNKTCWWIKCSFSHKPTPIQISKPLSFACLVWFLFFCLLLLRVIMSDLVYTHTHRSTCMQTHI